MPEPFFIPLDTMNCFLILIGAFCIPVLAACDGAVVAADGAIQPKASSYYEFTTYRTDAEGIRTGPFLDTVFVVIEAMQRYGKRGVLGLFKGRPEVDTIFLCYEANGDLAITTAELDHEWQIYPFASKSARSWTLSDTTYDDGSSYQVKKTRAHAGSENLILSGGEVLSCQIAKDIRTDMRRSSSGDIQRQTVLVEQFWYPRSTGYFSRFVTTETVADDAGRTTTTSTERTLTKYHVSK
ncbi:MAG: hypothetical protein BGO89_08205 [Candidatus Kapaibacterium thiocyanatum]|uniref:Uncharacterized protein n=1 Tax=Candidatus Kapaibacterium thiocyanatum TaxID=1895771 RepID=A0A1M3L3S1_9BACT|nr:MAG: hypothetical protein BGO89_08205 ['Candidatus Kapabacteria' thiocyanatum]